MDPAVVDTNCHTIEMQSNPVVEAPADQHDGDDSMQYLQECLESAFDEDDTGNVEGLKLICCMCR